MNQKTQNQLCKISPTLQEYVAAKLLIKRFEKNQQKLKSIINKKFYVQMPSDCYSVGTFGGWDKNGNILIKIQDVEPFYHIPNTHYISTPIEDVFEKKQKTMKILHVGVE